MIEAIVKNLICYLKKTGEVVCNKILAMLYYYYFKFSPEIHSSLFEHVFLVRAFPVKKCC